MELLEFKELLKTAKLNKKTFAEYVNIPYQTVSNWGTANRPPVPDWVKTLLNLYIKNRNYEELKKFIVDNKILED